MSKRRQTTGMPTKKRTSQIDETAASPASSNWFDNLLGNPVTRADREDAINKLLTRSLSIITGIIVVLIAIGLIYDQIIVPSQSVATVNGQAITVREFRERVRFERALLSQQLENTILQIQSFGMDPNEFLQQEPYSSQLNELNFPDQLGRRVLDDLINDKLIEQEASTLNVSVDETAVEAQVNDFFGFDPTAIALIGVDPTATPEPTITPTPFVSPTPAPPTVVPSATAAPEVTAEAEATAEADAEATAESALPEATSTLPASPTPSADDLRENFETNVTNFRQLIRETGGVGDDQIDAYFERQALREAVSEAVYTENTAVYVNARHILVEAEEDALDIISALEAGESFAELAGATSIDTGSGANGGELGWSSASNYVEEFRDAVLTLPIGVLSEPVQSQFGYHIIQVRAREDREVTGQELDSLRNSEFAAWLEEMRLNNEDNIEISDNWPDYVPR